MEQSSYYGIHTLANIDLKNVLMAVKPMFYKPAEEHNGIGKTILNKVNEWCSPIDTECVEIKGFKLHFNSLEALLSRMFQLIDPVTNSADPVDIVAGALVILRYMCTRSRKRVYSPQAPLVLLTCMNIANKVLYDIPIPLCRFSFIGGTTNEAIIATEGAILALIDFKANISGVQVRHVRRELGLH